GKYDDLEGDQSDMRSAQFGAVAGFAIMGMIVAGMLDVTVLLGGIIGGILGFGMGRILVAAYKRRLTEESATRPPGTIVMTDGQAAQDLTDTKQPIRVPLKDVHQALTVLYSGDIPPKTFVEKYLSIISDTIVAVDLERPPETGRGDGPASLGFRRSTLSLKYGTRFHIGPMPLRSHIMYLLNISQILLESGHPDESG